MCGIAGIVDFGPGFDPSLDVLERMTDVIRHRGPDDFGFHVGPHIALGHRRLSIIDLKSGHQPMYDAEKTAVIVFNGEIYNFQSIRSDLKSLGVQFRSQSDTEVLLESYKTYGLECLKRLRGMFAFAIWDASRRRLFVARDRLGKKPVYYFASGNRLVFGSEIKSILAAQQIDRRVNFDALDAFLSLGYTLSPHTTLEGIWKLPAAHYLLFDESGLHIERYWRLQEQDLQPKLKPEEGIDSLKKTINEAVSLRMISDVPVGAYLSGGLDSSIIVGTMTQFSEKPVRTFTIGYENAPRHSELNYAAIVAKHFRTEHTEIILKPVDFFDLIQKMVFHLEEPIGDQACIPLFLISEQAKREVTVMLSGEGADETFGGYNIYVAMQLIEYCRRLPAFVRSHLMAPLIRAIFDTRRASKYQEWLEEELPSRYLGDMADLSDSLKLKLYSKEFYRHVCGDYRRRVRDYYEEVPGSSLIDRMTYLDINTWLVEDLLLKADKMTMAASIELRTPFLDHELVELSRRLPPYLKVAGLRKKVILKKAYESFLPKEIIHRRKKGFPVPLSLWFGKNLNDMIGGVLLDDRAKQRGYFNIPFVETMLLQQRKGEVDWSKTLWNLLVLEVWHREFVDASAA